MKSDEFIREVDEELQREKLAELAKRYGWIAVAAAVGVVLATAAWVGWQRWNEHRRETEAERFAAVDGLVGPAGPETVAALLHFAREASPGFSALARLRAAARAEDDRTALEALDAVAADPVADPLLKDAARLMAAARRVGRDDPGAVARSLESLAGDGGPWRHVARQLVAAAQLEADAREQAIAALRRIVEDGEAPPTLRSRAAELLDALGAPLPARSTS